MNILVDVLPVAIEIEGKEYKINADYRTCLRTIMAFENSELTFIEKQMILLENMYIDKPDNVEVALEKGMQFLNCGNSIEENSGEGSARLYAFEKDAKFIFAAFQQTHGIDLTTTNMHWWQFYALFMDLGKDTTFSTIIGLRHRLQNGTATKEERRMAADMVDILYLPDFGNKTLEELEAEKEFMEALGV